MHRLTNQNAYSPFMFMKRSNYFLKGELSIYVVVFMLYLEYVFSGVFLHDIKMLKGTSSDVLIVEKLNKCTLSI